MTTIKDIKGPKEFDKIYTKSIKKCLLVKFYSNSCKPCKTIQPFLIEMYERYIDVFDFVQVNVSKKDNSLICDTYNVKELPTLVFMVKGLVTKIIVGDDTKIIKKEFKESKKKLRKKKEKKSKENLLIVNSKDKIMKDRKVNNSKLLADSSSGSEDIPLQYSSDSHEKYNYSSDEDEKEKKKD